MRPWRPITLPMSSSATCSLQDDGAVPLGALDADLVRLVDEVPREVLEHLFHATSAPPSDAGERVLLEGH